MKIFENKSILKKVIIVLLIILVFSLGFSGKVEAKDAAIGGKLLDPLMSMFVSLGDGAISLLQKVILHTNNSIIEITTSTTLVQKVLTGIAVAVVVVGGIASIVASGGVAGAITFKAVVAGAKVALQIAKVGAIVGTITYAVSGYIANAVLPEDCVLPNIDISPYEIFSNQIPILDVDFFNISNDNGQLNNDSTEDNEENVSSIDVLRPIVANWYVILRDIAIVALLSILVYVGIRIVISSTGKDKAKYKQMLMDWIVAICLLFVMQYIMTFANLVVKKITGMVDLIDVSTAGTYEREGVQVFTIEGKQAKKAYKILVKNEEDEEMQETYAGLFDGEDKLYWPADNFTEQARMMLQYVDKDDGATSYAYTSIGWKLIYCILVIYTFVFMFTYVKRFIYMTFLTLIAPLVALTYPIDKLGDGKAQAFNMWFKEYIFNLLIQPMHLLLYTILVGTAMQFASKNIIYVVVALGFMAQGEKLLRKFFGFEKAQTPGLLAGPAGAAVMMSGMNKLLGKAPHDQKKVQSGGNGGSSDSDDDKGVRWKDSSFDKDEAIFGTTQVSDSKKYLIKDGDGNVVAKADNFIKGENGGVDVQGLTYDVFRDGHEVPKPDFSKPHTIEDNPEYIKMRQGGTDTYSSFDRQNKDNTVFSDFSNRDLENSGIDSNIIDLDEDDYSIRDVGEFDDKKYLMKDMDGSVLGAADDYNMQSDGSYDVTGFREANSAMTSGQSIDPTSGVYQYVKNPDYKEDMLDGLTGNQTIQSQGIDIQDMESQTARNQTIRSQGIDIQEMEPQTTGNQATRTHTIGDQMTGTQPTRTQSTEGQPTRTQATRTQSSRVQSGSSNDERFNPGEGKDKIKRHPIKAIKPSAKYYMRGIGENIKKNAENSRPMRTLAKTASGVALGAAAATAGVMGGIVAGDASKGFQYTAAGAIGGYKAGSGMANRLPTIPEDVKEAHERASYESDDDYKRAKQAEYIRKYQTNRNNLLELESKYGSKEAKRIMKEDVPVFLNNGVTDIKDIKAIEEMVKDKDVKVSSIKAGIGIKKYSDRIQGDYSKLSAKKQNEWRNTFRSEFANKSAYKDQDHDEMADNLITNIKAFNKKKD